MFPRLSLHILCNVMYVQNSLNMSYLKLFLLLKFRIFGFFWQKAEWQETFSENVSSKLLDVLLHNYCKFILANMNCANFWYQFQLRSSAVLFLTAWIWNKLTEVNIGFLPKQKPIWVRTLNLIMDTQNAQSSCYIYTSAIHWQTF